MEKLTIKELAPYLPYELKGKYELSKWQIRRGIEEKYYPLRLYSIEDFLDGFYIPILRPLSDLTKEIEVNGEKFKPYDKLNFNYHIWNNELVVNGEIEGFNVMYVYDDFKIFFKYHFDIFGLIKKGLAIDINTLQNESI